VVEAGKDPEKERALVGRMRALLQPFVLRRLKNELKDQLVDKSHVMHEVRLRLCACMHACACVRA
jgi:hypothetical protein